MTTLSTWTVLETIRDRVLNEELGSVMNVAGILACIMAGISIVNITRDYIRGTDLDAWEFLRPIIIMLMTCSFNQVVLGPVNAITNVVTGRLADITNVDTGSYFTQWSQNMGQMAVNSVMISELDYQEQLEEIAEEDSMVGRFFSKVWISIKKMFKVMFGIKSMSFAGIIGGILFVLVKILMFIQQILCSVYLLMNSVLGPLIMAMCILPGFEKGFRNWLARYIQIAMWVPVGYFLLAINLWISKGCCDFAMMQQIGLGIEWLMICLQIVALVGVAAVPKIAAWVIESSGANDAHGSMSNPARMVARKMLKI